MDVHVIELTEPWPSEFEDEKVSHTAITYLGPHGRLLSWSKSKYRAAHVGEIVVFNANVFLSYAEWSANRERLTVKWRKLWYGDLNLSLDGDKLQALADELGAAVAVLYEMDGRFDCESAPKIEDAAAVFEPCDLA